MRLPTVLVSDRPITCPVIVVEAAFSHNRPIG
jgi:hypothetical protein